MHSQLSTGNLSPGFQPYRRQCLTNPKNFPEQSIPSHSRSYSAYSHEILAPRPLHPTHRWSSHNDLSKTNPVLHGDSDQLCAKISSMSNNLEDQRKRQTREIDIYQQGFQEENINCYGHYGRPTPQSVDDLARHPHLVSSNRPRSHHRSHRHSFQPYSHSSSTTASRAPSPFQSHSDLSDDEDSRLYPHQAFSCSQGSNVPAPSPLSAQFTPSTSPVLGPMRDLSLIPTNALHGNQCDLPRLPHAPPQDIHSPNAVVLPPLRLSSSISSNSISPSNNVYVCRSESDASVVSLSAPRFSIASVVPLSPESQLFGVAVASQCIQHPLDSTLQECCFESSSPKPLALVGSFASEQKPEPDSANHRGRLVDILNGGEAPLTRRGTESRCKLPPLSSITRICEDTTSTPFTQLDCRTNGAAKYHGVTGPADYATTNNFAASSASNVSLSYQSRSAPVSRVNSPPNSPRLSKLPPINDHMGRSVTLQHQALNDEDCNNQQSVRKQNSRFTGSRIKNQFGLQMTPIEKNSCKESKNWKSNELLTSKGDDWQRKDKKCRTRSGSFCSDSSSDSEDQLAIRDLTLGKRVGAQPRNFGNKSSLFI
ncbi:hypothetical protein BY996DRAFT_1982183 [Phakopsora pachyrhizi]|nr:hypothetical protein BY996DRAFT_1982183 [Phakopsora pachyrhizi]